MIIEITGCTSSGKTTSSECIINRLKKDGFECYYVHDYLLDRMRLNWIKSEIVKNVIFDCIAIVMLLKEISTSINIIITSFKYSQKYGGNILYNLNIFRNVLKKIGIYYLILKKDNNQTLYFYDEGPFHCVHNLFVHYNREIPDNDIKQYIRNTILPEVIIIVSASHKTIVERAIGRGGHRRVPQEEYLDCFMSKCLHVFDVAKKYVTGKTIILMNNDKTTDEMLNEICLKIKVLFENEKSNTRTVNQI